MIIEHRPALVEHLAQPQERRRPPGHDFAEDPLDAGRRVRDVVAVELVALTAGRRLVERVEKPLARRAR